MAKNGHLYAKPYLIAEKRYGFPRFNRLKSVAILADNLAFRSYVINRHKKGINVAYADGSAKWVALSAFDFNVTIPGPNPLFPGSSFKYSDITTVSAANNKWFLEEETNPAKPTGIWAALDNAK
jgi:prepilin-type processing-associated H-X9-DG protein